MREEVLIKAKKLPPVMLERIESRFDLIRRTVEAEYHRRRADYLAEGGRDGLEEFVAGLEGEFRAATERVLRFQQAIRESNEPRILPEASADVLEEIAATTFPDFGGQPVPYITAEELHFLSIPKGSLDPEERKQIESHVTHTYHFLNQIPWTENLSRVVDIAYGHHEKLDGTGYPRGVAASMIPVQTRVMTVADIFDALTASDRPYKKALPPQRALDILDMEGEGGPARRERGSGPARVGGLPKGARAGLARAVGGERRVAPVAADWLLSVVDLDAITALRTRIQHGFLGRPQ